MRMFPKTSVGICELYKSCRSAIQRVSLAPESKTGGWGRERTGEVQGSSFQRTGSPWEVPGGRSQGPTRRKATCQPRPGPAQAPPPTEREAAGRGWTARSPAGVSPVHVVGGGARPRHHPV